MLHPALQVGLAPPDHSHLVMCVTIPGSTIRVELWLSPAAFARTSSWVPQGLVPRVVMRG